MAALVAADGASTHHIALMHLRVHGELDDEPGGVPEDECWDQVPVDYIS